MIDFKRAHKYKSKESLKKTTGSPAVGHHGQLCKMYLWKAREDVELICKKLL